MFFIFISFFEKCSIFGQPSADRRLSGNATPRAGAPAPQQVCLHCVLHIVWDGAFGSSDHSFFWGGRGEDFQCEYTPFLCLRKCLVFVIISYCERTLSGSELLYFSSFSLNVIPRRPGCATARVSTCRQHHSSGSSTQPKSESSMLDDGCLLSFALFPVFLLVIFGEKGGGFPFLLSSSSAVVEDVS